MKIIREELDLGIKAELFYQDEIKDRTIILSSGLGGDGRRGKLIPPIIATELDFNAIRYSHPSHLSNHLSGFETDYQGLDIILKALKERGLADNTLVGTSYGAFVCMDYLSRNIGNSDVNKVVLLEPLLGMDSFTKGAQRFSKGVSSISDAFNLQRVYMGNTAEKDKLHINLKEFTDYILNSTPDIGDVDVCAIHANCPHILHKIFDSSTIEKFARNRDGSYIRLNMDDLQDRVGLFEKYPELTKFLEK